MSDRGVATAEECLRQGRELLGRADRHVFQGEAVLAKHLYGAAIDFLLEGRHFDAAIETCRKLIRIAPDVVRARYTLAFLLIGRRSFQEARRVLEEYRESVQRVGAHSFAVPRLSLLAHATEDAELRREIFEMAATLDGHLLALVESDEEDPEQVPSTGAFRERWERLLPVVLRQ